jgi:hypothetical protein
LGMTTKDSITSGETKKVDSEWTPELWPLTSLKENFRLMVERAG